MGADGFRIAMLMGKYFGEFDHAGGMEELPPRAGCVFTFTTN